MFYQKAYLSFYRNLLVLFGQNDYKQKVLGHFFFLHYRFLIFKTRHNVFFKHFLTFKNRHVHLTQSWSDFCKHIEESEIGRNHANIVGLELIGTERRNARTKTTASDCPQKDAKEIEVPKISFLLVKKKISKSWGKTVDKNYKIEKRKFFKIAKKLLFLEKRLTDGIWHRLEKWKIPSWLLVQLCISHSGRKLS